MIMNIKCPLFSSNKNEIEIKIRRPNLSMWCIGWKERIDDFHYEFNSYINIYFLTYKISNIFNCFGNDFVLYKQ